MRYLYLCAVMFIAVGMVIAFWIGDLVFRPVIEIERPWSSARLLGFGGCQWFALAIFQDRKNQPGKPITYCYRLFWPFKF